jgi:hypothetical protein
VRATPSASAELLKVVSKKGLDPCAVVADRSVEEGQFERKEMSRKRLVTGSSGRVPALFIG